MDIKEINLDDWYQSGEGATAISYFNKNDDSLMLKLFTGTVTASNYAYREFEFSKHVEACNVKTPKAIEIVSANGQLGIIYERIKDKVSFSKLCHDNPDKIEEYATEFAKELLKLHSLKCDSEFFTGINETVSRCISSSKVYHHLSKKRLFSFMDELGDEQVCIHGDAHSGNLIKANDTDYWIDLGAFTFGSHWYDIGGVYFFYKLALGKIISKDILHMNGRQLNRFYDAFVRAYLGSDDKEQIKTFNKKARRACLLFSIYTIDVEHYTGLANIFASIVIRDLSFGW